jgi:hypothetical protein
MVMPVREYDLNIFQQEYEVPDTHLEYPAQGTMWEYRKPWYIQLYMHDGQTSEMASEPIELTDEESAQLIESDTYFDNEVDTWYGLSGFLATKDEQLSPRLRSMFGWFVGYDTDTPSFICPACRQLRAYEMGSGDCRACESCCKCIGQTDGYCMPY